MEKSPVHCTCPAKARHLSRGLKQMWIPNLQIGTEFKHGVRDQGKKKVGHLEAESSI